MGHSTRLDRKFSQQTMKFSVTTAVCCVATCLIILYLYLFSKGVPHVPEPNELVSDQLLRTAATAAPRPEWTATPPPTMPPTSNEIVQNTDQVPRKPKLLSENKPVTADVRGNLGPPSVITSESTVDWLKDRWQAAKNMKGEPIPGEHWVEIDLEGQYHLEVVVIDWEVAYSHEWTLLGRRTPTENYRTIGTGNQVQGTWRPNKLHVMQTLAIHENPPIPVRYVRLLIHRPSTRFGSSIWRLQVWGHDVV